MISPASINPMLTELGRANVFRVVPRDDADGIVAGNYLADHWADKKIAILHDNTTFGKGSAEETKKQLNRRGVTEAIYEAYVPGKDDYATEIAGLQAADIAVVFIGGYHTEVALMARAARDRGYLVQLVTGAKSGDRGIRPHRRSRGRGHSLHLSRRPAPKAPKQRRSSSGSERRVSNQRVTPCTLTAPFRCGRRRPRKPARWSSRR